MAYSDEPQVVKSSASRRWLWWAIPLVVALSAVIIGASISGPIHEWRKEHSVHGPNHGTVYEIDLEGTEHKIELARNSEGYSTLFLTPAPANPETLAIRIRLVNAGEEGERIWRTTTFKPETGVWMEETDRLNPLADFKMEIEVERAGKRLWSGTRWAYGESDHHHH